MSDWKAPDWNVWEATKVVTMWEAVSLSLDYEPKQVGTVVENPAQLGILPALLAAESAGAKVDLGTPVICTAAEHPEYTQRLFDLESSIELFKDNGLVSLKGFARWARCAGWTLPDVLVRLGAHPPIDRAHWLRQDLWSERELVDMLCGLESGRWRPSIAQINSAEEQVRRAIADGALAVRCDRSNDGTEGRAQAFYGAGRLFQPATAIWWAIAKPGRFPDFPFTADDARALATPTDAPARKWPWGDHETELLRKLADAARQWWSTYDPSDPRTAPTNDAVANWLKEQGVAERNAQVMATILRADNVRTGPR
ncbi:MAG: hypothetical protein IT318_27650 [Anaerolineales bacterium]|nr:hypothetical protein [Anaerolineales bacterium]